jgi:membrane fusion protein (multidrug efflux system)
MKRILFILVMPLLFAACGGERLEKLQYPEDLDGKKKLLIEKKAELKELNEEIEKLNREIAELDTTKREKPRALVTSTKLGRKDFNRYIDIQSSVVADDIVSASSESGGRLIKLSPKEGDYVERGQLIGTVDLGSLDKQIAELNKSLELAKEVYERQSRLWAQKIGTEIQYLEAKNNKERIEKSLETIRFQQTKADFYAPISGVVDRVVMHQGEVVSPGAPIIQILSTSKVKVVADVPEIYLKSVKKGDWVTIKFPALGTETKGRISMIGRTINPGNRTFSVEVEMANQGSKLKPNLLASMSIMDYSQKNVVMIPLEILQQEVTGRNFIYVKENGPEGDFAKKVYVETDEANDGQVIIKQGLTGNEEIILSGARNLVDGELITLSKEGPME